MPRSGTGYSCIGRTETSSAYCPICAQRTVQVPASLAPRTLPSLALCCSAEHTKAYQVRIAALCRFVLQDRLSVGRLEYHTHTGNLTDAIGKRASALVDIIEIVKGKVRMRKVK